MGPAVGHVGDATEARTGSFPRADDASEVARCRCTRHGRGARPLDPYAATQDAVASRESVGSSPYRSSTDVRTLMHVDVPSLRRSIAWFCLALALLLSVTPRQAFVLCIEVDGCVSVAPSLEFEHCDGCEPHELEPAAGSASERSLASARTDGEEPCPCLDLEVPGTAEPKRVQAGSTSALDVHVLVALAERAFVCDAPPPLALVERAPRGEPRPPLLLEHVTTVVLHV